MIDVRVNKKRIQIILLLAILQFNVYGAVINTTSSLLTPTSTTISPLISQTSTLASTWTQPTFNFDFSSLADRNSTQNAMTQARTNWSSFFTERPKVTFTQSLTNFVKGSGNELRGTQNQIEGSKNKVIGMQNSLIGDENSIFGLKNNIFGSQNTILKGN